MNILFFGGGNIAQAIITGLISSDYEKELIQFIDRNKANKKTLKGLGIKESNSLQVGDNFDLIILCVKPKDAVSAVEEISSAVKNPKILSLVAGITSKRYLTISENMLSADLTP